MLKFSFYNRFIDSNLLKKKKKKKQDVSKNMPRCHFLLTLIVIAIMLIYEEFFRYMKMRRMLLRIGYVKLLIFRSFSKVIRCNTEVKN